MRRIATAFLLAVVAWPAIAQQATDEVAPEKATEVAAKEAVFAERQMVTAANPLAAQAGLEILRAGGSAADALVTVQTVLGLVEPQSSGIGGGAFLVYYDAASGSLTTIDGRETAPAAARPELFLDASANRRFRGGRWRAFGRCAGGLALLQTIHAGMGADWASLLARPSRWPATDSRYRPVSLH